MRIFLILGTCWGAENGRKCSDEEIGIWRGNHEFAAAMEKYARRGIGRGSYVATHLVEQFRPRLSEECASCHGSVVTCTSKTCWWPCLTSSASTNCLMCSKTNCQKAYMDCVGTKDEQALPPKPTVEPPSTTSSPTTTVLERRLDEDITSTTETPIRTITSTLPTLLPLDIELWETIDTTDEQ